LATATIAGLGLGAVMALAFLWATSPTDLRDELTQPLLTAVAVGAGVAVAGGALVGRWVQHHLAGSRRLVDEIDLIASVDPSHRATASGSDEVEALTRAVNGLARRWWDSISERDRAIAEGRHQAEQDRERLVTLMAELATGVLVCSAEGRILLYNSQAVQMLSAGGDRSPVGLGRSVFSVLDRGSLTNAIHRLELDTTKVDPVRLTTVGPQGQLLRTSVGPVRSDGTTSLGGFVLMIDEATEEHQGRHERDDLVRSVLEESRGRLAGIGGAVQMLEHFDDLDPSDVDRFHRIIREESDQLSGYLAGVQERHRRLTGQGWELTEMLCRDLVWALQRRLEAVGATIIPCDPGDELWVGVDAGGVIEVVAALVDEVAGDGDHPARPEVEMTARPHDGFVALEVTFGDGVPTEVLEVAVSTGSLGHVARRHGGEAWQTGGERPTITVLLPRVEAVVSIAGPVPGEDRPTTYDFDLLSRQPVDAEQAGRSLSELSYTVFDLETTGVEPTRGDRILSVGAVRIVNGRLLRHETFDRLVDPERDIPEKSTAIHGITTDQVAGQPTIETVLPSFARFVEHTILVGHNLAFDMRFLELARPATGVRMDHAVLDTLLLGELAFGESEIHSLDWMAETLGVDVIGRHTALGDALVTAEVFLRLVPLLETKGLRTLGAATDAAATTRYARLEY
jgi:DNA polymerase-3 subunit epsilon